MAEFPAPDVINVIPGPILGFDEGHKLVITDDGELVLPVPFTDFHHWLDDDPERDWIHARWAYGYDQNEVTIMFPADSGIGRELARRGLVRDE